MLAWGRQALPSTYGPNALNSEALNLNPTHFPLNPNPKPFEPQESSTLHPKLFQSPGLDLLEVLVAAAQQTSDNAALNGVDFQAIPFLRVWGVGGLGLGLGCGVLGFRA